MKNAYKHHIPHPFECDPTNSNNFCWLYYNITKYDPEVKNPPKPKYVGQECRCSLGHKMKRDFSATSKSGWSETEYVLRNNSYNTSHYFKVGDKEGAGFCGKVMGTDIYSKAMSKIKTVLEGSKCHTLDRDNWRAQNDKSCGLGGKDDLESQEDWLAAVTQNFTLDHYPYMQNEQTKDCILKMSFNSPENIAKGLAGHLIYTMTVTVISFMILV